LKKFGGSLSDYTSWLLERSMKTLTVRFYEQQKNAKILSSFLKESSSIEKVHYPGIDDNEFYAIASKQMDGFGAVISFELTKNINPKKFLTSLELINPSMSFAGVESTMLSPAETSHQLLTRKQRIEQGIVDNLIRFSVGIEDTDDLIEDISFAIQKCKK
jgi:cystathionine beta-lyase